VRGLRCLDVATYDGFYAFELERRGAAEVVATDISDHTQWDWPVSRRELGPERLAEMAGEKGRGFEVAREALGSRVHKVDLNVYDISPEALGGQFDVVVLGSLLLHLKNPVRALEAIRSVCRGTFLSIEAVSLLLTRLLPRRPAAELCPEDARVQWWTVNAAGHRRLLEASGFEVIRTCPIYPEPLGTGHWSAHLPRGSWRTQAVKTARRLALGGEGVPHAAVLARPRVYTPQDAD
jgi:tRNA (mo5U34)-methyltransferase